LFNYRSRDLAAIVPDRRVRLVDETADDDLWVFYRRPADKRGDILVLVVPPAFVVDRLGGAGFAKYFVFIGAGSVAGAFGHYFAQYLLGQPCDRRRYDPMFYNKTSKIIYLP